MKKKLCNELLFVESFWVRTSLLIAAFCFFVLLAATSKAQTVTNADGLYNALTGSSTAITLGNDIYTERFDEYDDPIGFVISEGEGNAIARTIKITSGGKKIRYDSSGKSPYDEGVEFFMEIVQGGALEFLDDADLGGGYGSNAGLFYLTDNATLTFKGNAIISNNDSDSYGAIGAETGPNGQSPTLTFEKNALFEKNIGGEGGALSLLTVNMGSSTKRSLMIVKGKAEFKNNFASSYGGAVYLFESDLQVDENIIVQNNKSYGDGGAFYLTNGADFRVGKETSDVLESSFLGNIAGYDENDPTATSNGGAIAADMGSVIEFNHKVVFGDATATNGNKGALGGAIYLDTASANFNGTAVFQNNQASYDGGAMYVYDGQVVFQKDTGFLNNKSADGNGGALYLSGSETKVEFKGTTTFNSNSALGTNSYGGGAIYADYLGDPTLANGFGFIADGKTVFQSNVADQMGGAIYADESSMKFSSAEFKGNESKYSGADGGGGAIFATGDTRLVFNGAVEMSGNKATSGSGGAVYADMIGFVGDDPTFGLEFNSGVLVDGNTAVSGGGFYLFDSAITFAGSSEIKNNSATGYGGAFAVEGYSLIDFQAGSNTVLSANKATSGGGAINVLDGSELTLKLHSSGQKYSKLSIEAGTSGAGNDIRLGDGGILIFDTDAGSSVTISSNLSGGVDTGTMLQKLGAGDVFLNGDASAFLGLMSVEKGKVHIGESGKFGNINSTVLEIFDGASIVLAVPDTPTGNARLSLNDLTVDSSSSNQILVKAMSDSANPTDKHTLIELFDDQGDKDLQDYLDQIGSYYDFLTIETSTAYENNKAIIYGIVKYDNTAAPVFNLDAADDVFTLNASLNKPTDNLEVNGLGQLKLKGGDNQVAALTGDGNIMLDGTTSQITLSGSGSREFSGNLAGTGSLIVDGAGLTQILSGNGTYTGGTTVKAGTLQGSTKNLQHNIEIKDGGKIVFDQTQLDAGAVGTFSGTLTGSGTVEITNQNAVSNGIAKDGGMKISGDNSAFGGKTNVSKGWLILDSAQAKIGGQSISLASGAGIGGFGTISAPVLVNGGGIQAYGGTLNISGMSGSDYALEIKQGGTMYVFADGQQTNVVDVAGNVKLDGATVKVVGVGQNYVEDESFDFLKANQIDGTFVNSTASYSDGTTTWDFDLSKSDDNKSYSMKGTGENPDPPGPIPVPTPAGLTWNQGEVARALNTVDGYSETPVGFQAMIDDLNQHKTVDENGNPQYDEVYRDITGRQLAGAVRSNGLQLGLYSPYRTVFNRLSLGSELYSGMPVIYNNGYGPIGGLERTRGGAADETFLGQIGCVPQDESCSADCSIPCMMGENNFWIDVIHVQTKTKSDSNSDRYGISRTGFLLGMDVQKTPSSRFGMLFGYFAPYLWQQSDRVEADDYHAGLYFQKAHQGTELYGYFGYAHQRYDSRRYVDLSGLGAEYGKERYTGKTKGDSFNFSLELSRPRYYGCEYILRPLIGLDYYYTSQKGYTESGTGTGLYALQYGKAEYDQWFGRIGLTLKKETFRYSSVIRLQYINQFGENPYPDGGAEFAYIAGAPWMNVRGVDLKRDYFNAGFGINLFINSARSKLLSFDYDANMSQRTTAHGFSLVYIERF